MTFDVTRPGEMGNLSIELAIPGNHNVLNALAAIAIASHIGVSDQAITSGLCEFQGIGRRFQIFGEVQIGGSTVTLVDDYAHHPVELAATLQAAHGCWPDKRILAVFQPHRYSRTNDLFEDFVQVLVELPDLFVCEVYAAGEEPISGATGKALCQAIRVRGASNPIYVADVDDLEQVLAPVVQADDVILTMGAGSIGKASRSLYERLLSGGGAA